MRNKIFNTFLFESELRQWEAAILLGIRPESLCRKLRFELSDDEQKNLVSKIQTSLEKGENSGYKA